MSIVNVGAAENDGNGDPWRDAFRKLNAVGGSVVSRTTDNPGSPTDGDFYIVPESPTGAFAGQANNLAWYNADTPGWEFTTTPEGFQIWVADDDERVEWTGSAWQTLQGGGGSSGGAISSGDFTGFAKYSRPGDIFTAENGGTPVSNAYVSADETWAIETLGDDDANFAMQTAFAGSTDFDVVGVLTTRLSNDGGIYKTGLAIGASGSGKKMLIALDETGIVTTEFYTDTTQDSVELTYQFNDGGPSLGAKTYFRIARVGTDYNFYISQNGLDWDLVDTFATTDHGTFGDADEIGLFLICDGTVGGTTRNFAKCVGWDENGPQAEALTGNGAGVATVTKVRTARYTLSADQVETGAAAGFVVEFDTIDTSAPFEDIGLSVAAGVFTVPAELDGKLIRMAAQIGTTNSASPNHMNTYYRLNSTAVYASDLYTGNSASDMAVPSGKMRVQTGDTIEVFFRHQDNTLTVESTTGGGAHESFLIIEVEDDVVIGGVGQDAPSDSTPYGRLDAAWVQVQLDNIGKVSVNSGALTTNDVGRTFGLLQVTGGVQFGLLGRPEVIPLGGGGVVLGDWDLGSSSETELEITDIDRFERVEFFFYEWDWSATTGTLYFNLSDDNNVSALSHNYRTQRISGASTLSEASSNNSGTDVFIVSHSTGAITGRLTITGMDVNAGLLDVHYQYATPGVGTGMRLQKTTHDVSGVNGFGVYPASGSFNAGRVIAIGYKANIQPINERFDYAGSPGSAITLDRIIAPIDMTLLAGASGAFRVGTAPTAEAIVNIDHEGTDVGTLTIAATTGVVTVDVPSDVNIDKGDLLILESDGVEDFTDLYGSLTFVARDA